MHKQNSQTHPLQATGHPAIECSAFSPRGLLRSPRESPGACCVHVKAIRTDWLKQKVVSVYYMT